jgi:hypothetical protein
MNDTRTERLAVSPEDRAAGVTALQVITFKRATIVIAESAEGFIAVGHNAPWPNQANIPHIGVAMARRNAIDRMMQIRARGKTQNRERAGA